MGNFLIFFVVVLVVAAIIKPSAPLPGLGGWLRDYASFLRTCLRVAVVFILLLLLLIMVGSFNF